MARYLSPTGITPFPQGKFVTGCIDLMNKRNKDGLFIRLFYPTNLRNVETHSSQWTQWYLGEPYTNGLAKMFLPSCQFLFKAIFRWQTSSSCIPSVWEGAFAGKKFPVVVFSHGWCAHRGMYSTTCSDISSYGFIVASIEHRDGSACSTFTLSEKGEPIWHDCEDTQPGEKEYPIRARQVKIRVKECSRTLDLLNDLNNGKVINELKGNLDLSVFRNHVDVTKPVIMGHSFGGSTVILTLSNDNRFKLGVSLDPWMFPLKEDLQEIRGNLKQPFLSILTEGFLSDANVLALKKIYQDNTSNIMIRGTVHQTQTDTPFVSGFIGQLLMRLRGKIDRYLAMGINNQMVINFICNNLGLNIEKPDPEVDLIIENCSFGIPPLILNRDESLAYLKASRIVTDGIGNHADAASQLKTGSKL